LSPELATRIGKLTRTSPESWLWMQTAVDLWEVERHPDRLGRIMPIEAAA
jgi:plasmid maintenance system antidote protein VapI